MWHINTIWKDIFLTILPWTWWKHYDLSSPDTLCVTLMTFCVLLWRHLYVKISGLAPALVSSLEKGWRWQSHEACLNICAQSQEFCMSALWVYLSNSTSLVVESLYHKLYAITEVIVDLTPHRGTNKHLLRHPHCRSIPVCIYFVYQCICGNKFFFWIELNWIFG